MHRNELSVRQCGSDVTGRVRAADEGVTVIDVRDRSVQRLLDDLARVLDLGQLRHSNQSGSVPASGGVDPKRTHAGVMRELAAVGRVQHLVVACV